ncbi:MAG TPA: hypothetical protein VK892_10955 [Pyrinomonadaceae bacterium]|nr:hypothetical protein [Pyrinomonadaceae bacterium]
MKKLFLPLILLAAFHAGAAAQDKRIEEIQRIYQEIGRKIGDAEKAFAMSKREGGIAETEIFLSEMQFNKGNTSYPAVGIFREDTKFYFTFKSGAPYPERLLKIVTITYRSAAVEHREYLFDAAGQLIFYFEDPDSENMDRSEETRLYFAGGKLIRFQVGDDVSTNNPIFRRKNEIAQEVLEKQKKIVNVLKNSV